MPYWETWECWMVTWQSIGLSNKCFPNIICPAIPNIYPFIVNDPGEGSQAKRRTANYYWSFNPPLDRSELYGKYSILENYLDEYYSKIIKF